ncbi:MAG TPA: hypothetical protein DCZ63_09065 [Geobacter sp.]|nr:hypothetical protein [Geobacter sp.]
MFDHYELITLDRVPLIVRGGIEIPYKTLAEFPNCCGAGEGFWERVVPERIFFLRVSAACWAHDTDMEMTEPTDEAFELMNRIFLINTLSIIDRKSRFELLKMIRRHGAMSYYNAVNTKLALGKIFWELKRKQKEAGQWAEYIFGETLSAVTQTDKSAAREPQQAGR